MLQSFVAFLVFEERKDCHENFIEKKPFFFGLKRIFYLEKSFLARLRDFCLSVFLIIFSSSALN